MLNQIFFENKPIVNSYKELAKSIGNNQTKQFDLTGYLPDVTTGYFVLVQVNFDNQSNSDTNSHLYGFTDLVGSSTNKIRLCSSTAHSSRNYVCSQVVWLPVKRYLTIITDTVDKADVRVYGYKKI